MIVVNKVYCLQLNYDVVVHHKIHPICLVKLYIIPIDWQKNLTFHLVAFKFQQVLQCSFVGRLQKTSMILAVHLIATPVMSAKNLYFLLCCSMRFISFRLLIMIQHSSILRFF